MNLWKMDSQIGYWEVFRRLGAGSRHLRLMLQSVTESCHARPSMAIEAWCHTLLCLTSDQSQVACVLEIRKPQKQKA